MATAAAQARDNRPNEAAELVDAAAAAAVRIGERDPGGEHLMMVGGFNAGRVQMARVEAAAVAGDPGGSSPWLRRCRQGRRRSDPAGSVTA
ncbi:hypothetical protein NKG94_39885 [Micromonospora sp. M12]